jgi:hypothetical protein
MHPFSQSLSPLTCLNILTDVVLIFFPSFPSWSHEARGHVKGLGRLGLHRDTVLFDSSSLPHPIRGLGHLVDILLSSPPEVVFGNEYKSVIAGLE